MFNFEKQRPVSDAEWPQESNGAICFSVRGLEPPTNHVWLYDVTISRHVVERNLAFEVKNRGIDLKFWAVVGVARCLTYNTVFWKFSKISILWSFLFIQKQKRCFWNFGGQNHEISKIRDGHLVELVILRLSCVLYAFLFNSLPFMDSQTIATFGSKIACSDVTKTLIAPKFSVRYFWNFVRRWSIQFVTATRSLARRSRAKPEL